MKNELKPIASEEVVTAINKSEEFTLEQALNGEVEFRDVYDKFAFYYVSLNKNKERYNAIVTKDEMEQISISFFYLLTDEKILKKLIKCVKVINQEYKELKTQRELTTEEKDKMYYFINIAGWLKEQLGNRQDRIKCWVDIYARTFKFENK